MGTPLWKVWNKMENNRKLRIFDSLIDVERKFLSVSFARYGNLYFTQDAFSGCEKAEIQGDVTQSMKEDVAKRFVIGPVVDRTFWHRERASMEIDRGPWENPQDYVRAIAQREIAWIVRYADLKTQHSRYSNPFTIVEPEMQRDISKHIAQYLQLRDVAEHLLPEGEKSRATIWHPQLSSLNMFIQEDQITGIVDWLDVWAGPLFLQVKRPSLVRYIGELLTRLPEDYESMNEDEKMAARRQVDHSLLQIAYDARVKKRNPILDSVNNVSQALNCRRAVEFAENSWGDDVISIRQVLIRVKRHWDETHPSIQCPISFTEKELKEHHPFVEDWNASAEFFDTMHLHMGMGRDGWITANAYDDAVQLFKGAMDSVDHSGDTAEQIEDWNRKMNLLFK
ncbi:hypothetical protein N0V90_000116 [Kalmusia sp. IMI 367209]|nr:hypothetical protein N0V90_000116 [Kalmusia sp. IMI 367209]